MKIQHYTAFEPIDASEIEKAFEGVTMRRVISEVDGAENFTMDVFEIAPGGHTAYHSHPWEHENFVISGHGVCRDAEGDRPFREGDVLYIAPNEFHQVRNTGATPLLMVCVIPKAALTAYYLAHSGHGGSDS
jgi:quercetin dioxygenase-like cupin family protein